MCFFKVAQAHFEIMRRENSKWDVQKIVRITDVRVIAHNMLINTTKSLTVPVVEHINNVDELIVERKK